jgi:hypothetical protein
MPLLPRDFHANAEQLADIRNPVFKIDNARPLEHMAGGANASTRMFESASTPFAYAAALNALLEAQANAADWKGSPFGEVPALLALQAAGQLVAERRDLTTALPGTLRHRLRDYLPENNQSLLYILKVPGTSVNLGYYMPGLERHFWAPAVDRSGWSRIGFGSTNMVEALCESAPVDDKVLRAFQHAPLWPFLSWSKVRRQLQEMKIWERIEAVLASAAIQLGFTDRFGLNGEGDPKPIAKADPGSWFPPVPPTTESSRRFTWNGKVVGGCGLGFLVNDGPLVDLNPTILNYSRAIPIPAGDSQQACALAAGEFLNFHHQLIKGDSYLLFAPVNPDDGQSRFLVPHGVTLSERNAMWTLLWREPGVPDTRIGPFEVGIEESDFLTVAHICIWPPEHIPDWTHYYLASQKTTEIKNGAPIDIAVWGLGSDALTAGVADDKLDRIEHYPNWISLKSKGKSCGVLGIASRQLAATGVVNVAIDFGTTSSCARYHQPDGDFDPSNPQTTVIDLARMSPRWLTTGGTYPTGSFNGTFDKGPHYSSLLMQRSSPSTGHDDLRILLDNHVPGLFVSREGEEALLTNTPGWSLRGSAKWTLGGARAFLSKFLPAVLASASAVGRIGSIVLTYPARMPPDLVQSFKQETDKIIELYLRGKTAAFVTESEAAAWRLNPNKVQTRKVLTIDLGGGTVDFALSLANANGNGFKVFVDSLRVGGNDVLRYLGSDLTEEKKIAVQARSKLENWFRPDASNVLTAKGGQPDFANWFGAFVEARKKDRALESLEALVRTRGNQSLAIAHEKNSRLLFADIAAYAEAFSRCADPHIPTTTYIIGNAWKLRTWVGWGMPTAWRAVEDKSEMLNGALALLESGETATLFGPLGLDTTYLVDGVTTHSFMADGAVKSAPKEAFGQDDVARVSATVDESTGWLGAGLGVRLNLIRDLLKSENQYFLDRRVDTPARLALESLHRGWGAEPARQL